MALFRELERAFSIHTKNNSSAEHHDPEMDFDYGLGSEANGYDPLADSDASENFPLARSLPDQSKS